MPIGDNLWGDSQFGDTREEIIVEIADAISIVSNVISAAEYRTSNSPNPFALSVIASAQAPAYIIDCAFDLVEISFTISTQSPSVYANADVVYLPSVISFICNLIQPDTVGSIATVSVSSISISLGPQSPTLIYSCNITTDVISLQALAQVLAAVSNDCGVSVAVKSLQAALQELRSVGSSSIDTGLLTSDEIMAGWWDCDECGFTYQKIKLIERWDGALVCNRCYETQHPLDEIYTY
jgi:hypothetical protein